jgi:hypothetical protein
MPSQSQAWKDLERRVCRALGAQRRPSVGARGWAQGSDDDGTAPFAVEVKRTKVAQLRGAWLAQARRNAKTDGRPWLIAIGTHRSPRIIAVLDFDTLVALARQAGIIDNHNEGGKTMLHETPQPPTDPPPEEGDGDEGDESS